MDDVEQLAEHVRYRIGNRAVYVGKLRCDELTRMVVMFWPHRHLAEAMVNGRSPKEIDHAMTLLRSQVRERWEALHGMGPMWPMMIAPTVAAVSRVVLELWSSDRVWAERLLRMGKQLRTGGTL